MTCALFSLRNTKQPTHTLLPTAPKPFFKMRCANYGIESVENRIITIIHYDLSTYFFNQRYKVSIIILLWIINRSVKEMNNAANWKMTLKFTFPRNCNNRLFDRERCSKVLKEALLLIFFLFLASNHEPKMFLREQKMFAMKIAFNWVMMSTWRKH